jgi:hypothetical protein
MNYGNIIRCQRLVHLTPAFFSLGHHHFVVDALDVSVNKPQFTYVDFLKALHCHLQLMTRLIMAKMSRLERIALWSYPNA